MENIGLCLRKLRVFGYSTGLGGKSLVKLEATRNFIKKAKEEDSEERKGGLNKKNNINSSSTSGSGSSSTGFLLPSHSISSGNEAIIRIIIIIRRIQNHNYKTITTLLLSPQSFFWIHFPFISINHPW